MKDSLYPQCHESVVLVARAVAQMDRHEFSDRANLRNQLFFSIVKPARCVRSCCNIIWENVEVFSLQSGY